jgi:hypothetical protein
MGMVIVGLVHDAHQARGLIRALDDAGFSGEDIDMQGGLLADLARRGVPAEDAHILAEGVRRGGAVVCVRTDSDYEAAEAAQLMREHGAIDIDACTAAWRRQPQGAAEHYAAAFGEYPNAPGRIYQDARTCLYDGPERRVRQQPYDGANRRAA